MVKLSVNVNKVATVRNSRGAAVPSVLDAVEVCLRAGAPLRPLLQSLSMDPHARHFVLSLPPEGASASLRRLCGG